MYNKVVLLGRITRDLELKTTPSGVSVLAFGIAVDRKYQAKGEERKSDFFNCVAWRNEAEFISRYWAKGRAILVEGELQNREYTDKNGVNRQITEVIVDRATFTGEAKAQGGPSANPPASPPAAQTSPTSADVCMEMTETDDDYPF